MAIYEVRTFQDIYNSVVEELKIQSTDTTQINRIKRDVNIGYVEEVYPYRYWPWARRVKDLTHDAYYSTGTISVTQGSRTATLSTSPSPLVFSGRKIQIQSYNTTYKIRTHSGTSITLDAPYQGTTNATSTFKLWKDGIVLPSEFMNVTRVWHDHYSESMEQLGYNDFTDLVLSNPYLEGRPKYFRIVHQEDKDEFDTDVSVLSFVRSSVGYIKTVTFVADVSNLIAVGDIIKVADCDNETYNGEFVVETVNTGTITYIGTEPLSEGATADGGMNFKISATNNDAANVMKLEVYPMINDDSTTIHVDGIRKIAPLENDTDEPIIPMQERSVLVYYALHKAWSRQRNPEEANRNFQLFQRKLDKMVSKIEKASANVRLSMDEFYLAGRRISRRRYNGYYEFGT